jgi:hypothetical protein
VKERNKREKKGGIAMRGCEQVNVKGEKKE